MRIVKHGRYWAVYDANGTLICLCVYRKGAEEVVHRLTCERTPEAPHGKPMEEILYGNDTHNDS